tara:strand:+ start:4926 stop:5126 length:201 start_codon:yes stop_codon:yes gene_type:complete
VSGLKLSCRFSTKEVSIRIQAGNVFRLTAETDNVDLRKFQSALMRATCPDKYKQTYCNEVIGLNPH